MHEELPPVRRRWGRLLGWGLVWAVLAALGWGQWQAYDYRAAVREARAAGFDFRESPTPFAAIREDWHAAFSFATWTEHRRTLTLDSADLAALRPLLLRLRPTELVAMRGRNVAALRGLTMLLGLRLDGSDVKDLAPLAGLAQLQYLDLGGCTGVTDLAPLAGLAQLQTLGLYRCRGVKDLAPLAGLAQLQGLYLTGCTGVRDLAPLAGLTQLQVLNLTGCTGLGAEAVAAFQKSHPQTVVSAP